MIVVLLLIFISLIAAIYNFGVDLNRQSDYNCWITLCYVGPHPPMLRVLNVSCGPQIHLSVQTQPLWPGYNISEFTLNTTNENNGLVLKQIRTPLKGQTDYENHFNETFEYCMSSVLFTATALSPVYGESMSSTINVTLDRRKKNLPTYYHYNNILFVSTRKHFVSSNHIYCVLLPKWHSICLSGDWGTPILYWHQQKQVCTRQAQMK